MTNPLPYPPHPGLNRCPQVLVVLLFFLSLLVTRRSPPRRGTAYRHSQSCGNYTQTSACPLGMLTRHVPHHFQQRPMWLHANSSTDNIPLEKRQFYSIITHTHTNARMRWKFFELSRSEFCPQSGTCTRMLAGRLEEEGVERVGEWRFICRLRIPAASVSSCSVCLWFSEIFLSDVFHTTTCLHVETPAHLLASAHLFPTNDQELLPADGRQIHL